MNDEDASSFSAEDPLPEPPFPVKLLADLDAGVLDERTSAHIRSRIVDDPGAQAVLDALARTREDLKSLPVDPQPVPDWVDARTQQTLAAISAEVAAGSSSLTDRRRRRSGRMFAVLGAAAAIVVAVVAIGVVFLRPDTNSVVPQANNSQSQLSTPAAPPDAAAVLSVLGRTDGAPFSSPQALRRCTSANGIPDTTAVLGSGEVTLDGTPQVVILLSTGTAGRFLALVVGHDCDTGNPATRSSTVIGR
ncbi:hypothetical protein Q9K23_12820 [Gordonia sp. NB41Y]|nr:hypothetical protein [Gordonia sp. NB41Y]EMP14607.2 hypothetical protein ISGA_2293 [Gordonia sp. NB41Y]WLP88510.1 hypothetical protein Q9K23_12820 [Gordonia sp. NB41Y]